jgi:mRNA interferase RelE/StbE
VWNIEIKKSAKKELADLPPNFQQQIKEKILLLKDSPFPSGAKKLQGCDGYRLRSGNYRILYEVFESTITIFAIGDRKDVYR